jgi:DNA-binding transcriptional regulator YiaG
MLAKVIARVISCHIIYDVKSYRAETMKKKQFSDQVKAVRAALNLSQEELAHALGVSFATVNRWENGKTRPSKMACTLFKAFCREKNLTIPGVDL